MLATKMNAWAALRAHHEEIAATHMRDLFADDAGRFDRFSVEACGLLLDYSKNRVSEKTMPLLHNLTREAGLEQWVGRMFGGEKVNNTEDRAALHAALRYRPETPVYHNLE